MGWVLGVLHKKGVHDAGKKLLCQVLSRGGPVFPIYAGQVEVSTDKQVSIVCSLANFLQGVQKLGIVLFTAVWGPVDASCEKYIIVIQSNGNPTLLIKTFWNYGIFSGCICTAFRWSLVRIAE
jgi:hypothetical protein